MSRLILTTALLLLATGLPACRLGETLRSKSLAALLKPNPEVAFGAKLVLRGELHLDLPSGMSPAAALAEPNAARVRQLVEWQLQYLHGALRHAPGLGAVAPVALAGRREILLIDASDGSRPSSVVVHYELRDRLIAAAPISATQVSLLLPRDMAAVFAQTGAGSDPSTSCAEGALVPEDHLWFFWDPAPVRCRLKAEELVKVVATVEPLKTFGPERPDYDGLFTGDDGTRRLRMVYMIGDDHAYRNGASGEAVLARASELLIDAGFSERGQRQDKRAVMYALKAGKTAVTLELQLVDPASFEFVKASAAALETADVFLYNGQTGFGNYLDWARYERILGRELALPRKPQIFAFSGASPFAFETTRLFAGKATTHDPEGFGALDVVTTTPSVPAAADGLVDVDVAIVAGLVSDRRGSWTEILTRTRDAHAARGVLSFVLGDH